MLLKGKVLLFIPSGIENDDGQQTPKNKLTDEDQYYKKTYPNMFKKKVIIPGESFGEISLLTNQTRTATIVCGEESWFLTLTKEGFDILIGQTHQLILQENINFLSQFDMIETLSKNKIFSLFHNMTILKYQYNNIIYSEDQQDDSIYFIKSGQVEISKMIQIQDEPAKIGQDNDMKNTQTLLKQELPRKKSSLHTLNRKSVLIEKAQRSKRVKVAILSQNSYFGHEEISTDQPNVRQYQAKSVGEELEVLIVKRKILMQYLNGTKGMDIFKQNIQMVKKWKDNQLNDTVQIHQLIKQQKRDSLNSNKYHIQNNSSDNIMRQSLNLPSTTELAQQSISQDYNRQYYQNTNQKNAFTGRFSITSQAMLNQNELSQNDQVSTTFLPNTQFNLPIETSPKSNKQNIQGFNQINSSQDVDSMSFSPLYKRNKASLFDIKEFGHSKNIFNLDKSQQSEVTQIEEHKLLNKASRKSSFQITSQQTLQHKKSDNSDQIESNNKLQLLSPNKLQQVQPGSNYFGNFSDYSNEKNDKQQSGSKIQLNNIQINEMNYKNNETSVKETNHQDTKNPNNNIYNRTNDMQIKSKSRLSLYTTSKLEVEQGEFKNVQQNQTNKLYQSQNNEKLSQQTLPYKNIHQQLSKQSSSPIITSMNKKTINLDYDQQTQSICSNYSKQNSNVVYKSNRLSESNFIETIDSLTKMSSSQNQYSSYRKGSQISNELVSPLIPIRKPSYPTNIMLQMSSNQLNELQQYKEADSGNISPMKTSVQEYFSNSNNSITHHRKSTLTQKNISTQPTEMKGIQFIQKMCSTPQSISNSQQITYNTPQHAFSQHHNTIFSPQNTFTLPKNQQNTQQQIPSSYNVPSNQFFSNKQKIDQQLNQNTQNSYNLNNPLDVNISQQNKMKEFKSLFVKNFYKLTKEKEQIYNTIMNKNSKNSQQGLLLETDNEKKYSITKQQRNNPSQSIRENRISQSMSPVKYQNNSAQLNENRESFTLRQSFANEDERDETQTIKTKTKSHHYVQNIKDNIIKQRNTIFHTQQNSIYNQQSNPILKTIDQQQQKIELPEIEQKYNQKTSELPLLVNQNSKKKIQIFCHTSRTKGQHDNNDLIQQLLQDKLMLSKSPR